MKTIAVFDGHKRCAASWQPARRSFKCLHRGYDAAIDVPKSKVGGFAGGFFAVHVPPLEIDHEARLAAMTADRYALPLPPELDRPCCRGCEGPDRHPVRTRDKRGAQHCCTVGDIRDAMDAGRMAAILHMEGAEAIDPDLQMLETLHQRGLRSLGPVWSRSTIFGHGVPFAFLDPGHRSGIDRGWRAAGQKMQRAGYPD